MRRTLLMAALLLAALFAEEGQADLGSSVTLLDQGIKAFQQGKNEEALGPFQQAATGLEQVLQGVLAQEDEAYAKYFLATANYYIAAISKDAGLFESTSQKFMESAGAFKSLNILGEEYVRSKYMRALCSFRQFELAKTDRLQTKNLTSAIGDFGDFLSDDDVKKNAADFKDLIENASYFKGYSHYMLGFLKSFDNAQLSNARKQYDDAQKEFQKAKNSSDERISISASYMEAMSGYFLARLFMRVAEDDWEKNRLASGERFAAIDSALKASMSSVDKMISSSGTQKDLQMFGTVAKYNNLLTIGSIGDRDNYNTAMDKFTDMRNDSKWGGDILNRLAYGSLLSFLVFNNPPKGATAALDRVLDKNAEALYWQGMVSYIMGEYDVANGKFMAYLGRAGAAKSLREKEIYADAKFRQAECQFWMGVKQSNPSYLSQADAVFKSLENPSGEYYDYLPKQVLDVVTLRRFVIGLETSIGKERNVSVFDAAMALAGLSLPKDAEKYINTGKYFLQKGILSAGDERKIAVKFADHAFTKVISSGASSEVTNRARFLKGVSLVKYSTVLDTTISADKSEADKTITEAKTVLDQCGSPYSDEAKYVLGIAYFNVNKYDLANGIFDNLKNKGHIRAAYMYALVNIEQKNCPNAAKALGSIQARVKNRADFWFQRAELELAGLSCAGAASGAPPLSSYNDAPMTYENLADEKAEIARKKEEALYVWQRSSAFVEVPNISELIPDRPPETNVTLEIAIDPADGDATLLIGGKDNVAQLIDKGLYKLTINRGSHKVTVKKKGFYLSEDNYKISKSERLTIKLNKAVRYASSGELSGTQKALALISDGENIYVAPQSTRSIVKFDKNGSKTKEWKYSELGIGGVSGLALDGDNLIIVDPKQNQVISLALVEREEEAPVYEETAVDSSDTTAPVKMAAPVRKSKISVIAYGGEAYGSKALSRPGNVVVSKGNYYICDTGNKRIVVFEGNAYRKSIGEDKLSHPMGLAMNGDELFVADLGKGVIFEYNASGEFKGEKTLKNQAQPAGIYISNEGFIFVADYAKNSIIKYTDEFKELGPAANAIVAPMQMTQIGEGPAAMVYVADNAGVTVLKGGWDNAYMPE